MATREQLVARRDTLQIELEAAVQRIAAGDRSKQVDLTVKQKAFERLEADIARIDAACTPMVRQIRISSDRGY